MALALVREGIWGLSLFAVARVHQGRGIGRELLEAALRPRRRRPRPPHPLDREPGRDAPLRAPGPRPAAVRRRRRDRRPRRGSRRPTGCVDAGHGGHPGRRRDRARRARRRARGRPRGRAATTRARASCSSRTARSRVVRDDADHACSPASTTPPRRASLNAALAATPPGATVSRRLPHRRPGLGRPRVPRRGARPLPRRPVLHRRRPRADAAVRPERGVPVTDTSSRATAPAPATSRRPQHRHAPSAAADHGSPRHGGGLMMDRPLLIRDIAERVERLFPATARS